MKLISIEVEIHPCKTKMLIFSLNFESTILMDQKRNSKEKKMKMGIWIWDMSRKEMIF